MTSDSLAKSERAELCALFSEVGAEAPTLCEGWTTKDLAAHLLIREQRPDAAVGIVIPPLAGYTDRVQEKAAERPYDELVSKIRNGPPRFSVFAVPGVDAMANTMEYFVHHEDVRRAEPGWEPRHLTEQQRDELWRRLRGASKMLLRGVDVPVVLVPTDVAGAEALEPPQGGVALRGPVAELTMHVYGRDQVRGVEVLGSDAAVSAYREGKRGV